MAYKPKVLTVSEGGTGDITNTAYSIICAGTTATGAFQNVSGVGTSAQVLTSNDAGALPTWQTATVRKGYTMNLQNQGFGSTPSNGTNYFLNDGTFAGITATGQAASRMTVPNTGTVKAITGTVTCTAGSSQTSSVFLYKNGSSTATITSSFKYDAASQKFTNTSMSTAVTAGDYLEIVFTTPTWTSAPTNVQANGTIYIE